jgi:hypothetical protein
MKFPKTRKELEALQKEAKEFMEKEHPTDWKIGVAALREHYDELSFTHKTCARQIAFTHMERLSEDPEEKEAVYLLALLIADYEGKL